jgi:type IV pilus assembly protein PilX
MSMTGSLRPGLAFSPSRHAQRGIALVVALILLVVATLIGLAGARGTLLQERMSANMYDRSLAFQRAEASLRAAEAAITSNWKIADLGGVDCSPAAATLCPVMPVTTFTASNSGWIDVGEVHDVNAALLPGAAQYHIQFMGTGSSESDFGFEANAEYGNYGSPYPPDDVAYYRVTARSSNPGDAGERSIVVLQTTVKRAY